MWSENFTERQVRVIREFMNQQEVWFASWNIPDLWVFFYFIKTSRFSWNLVYKKRDSQFFISYPWHMNFNFQNKCIKQDEDSPPLQPSDKLGHCKPWCKDNPLTLPHCNKNLVFVINKSKIFPYLLFSGSGWNNWIMNIFHSSFYQTHWIRSFCLWVHTFVSHNSCNVSEHWFQLCVSFLLRYL